MIPFSILAPFVVGAFRVHARLRKLTEERIMKIMARIKDLATKQEQCAEAENPTAILKTHYRLGCVLRTVEHRK